MIGIAVAQKGQSFIVGAVGAATFFGACILAIGRTIKKKTTNAIIKKVIIVLMKNP